MNLHVRERVIMMHHLLSVLGSESLITQKQEKNSLLKREGECKAEMI